MVRALELLPSIDFPQSGALVPELARLDKLLTDEQKQFWEDVAKSKDQRRAGLPKEYMETTQGVLETLDKLSNILAATVNHQDAVIDQLLSIRQSAGLLRNTIPGPRNVTAGTLSKFLPFSGQMRFTRLPGAGASACIPLVVRSS
ncbi:hypothetical protein [Bradyrhizobium sp. 139]|uniref:hypothetical protein n=1 Tax=Bradyrhizobium sp. 139 TaxID=2782616 RepID=UPI001FF7B116|nr:hypothetical protein [Bradyrhizobium sp. 139]